MNAPAATWALALADGDLTAAAALRIQQGVSAAVVGGHAWLCGLSPDVIEGIAGARRFRVDGAGALFQGHERIPCGHLPAGPWLPLADMLPVHVVSTPTLGELSTVTLSVVPDHHERPTAGLLVPWQELVNWVDTAPDHRCAVLRVARDRQDRALVLGTPLPPLRGVPVWSRGRVLIPCGSTLSPAVPPAWTQRLLDLSLDDHVLVLDGMWQHLPASAFASLARALVRSTAW